MAISGTDTVLVDTATGVLLNADSTVVVPEVLGAAGYDILYDTDAAIEYGEAQGVKLEEPGTEGLEVSELADQPRGYLAIDLDTGYVTDAENLVLIPYTEDAELEDPEKARVIASSSGQAPVVHPDVLEAAGLPFESVLE